MKYKGQSMPEIEKMTVLCFDEIQLIMEQIEIEKSEEKAIGPNKKYQVIVSRGLFKKWKQPVYFQFDQAMTKDIILNVIKELYSNGFTVVALTCDLGSTNQAVLKELGIDPIADGEKTYFQHPCDIAKNIHVFVPHLIKLLKNLLDSGLHINGKLINKSCLERLLQINVNDLKIVHKLSRLHLDITGFQRQNFKLATQIFSNTNAAAIEWCGLRDFMNNLEWAETARFLRLFKWFDLFNSISKFGNHEGLHAYGVDLEKQKKTILNEVTNVVKNMRIGKRKSLLPTKLSCLPHSSSVVTRQVRRSV